MKTIIATGGDLGPNGMSDRASKVQMEDNDAIKFVCGIDKINTLEMAFSYLFADAARDSKNEKECDKQTDTIRSMLLPSIEKLRLELRVLAEKYNLTKYHLRSSWNIEELV